MSERADALRRKLIRNVDEVPKHRELRPPLYDTECARLAEGTAAVGLGMGIDVLAPGMRGSVRRAGCVNCRCGWWGCQCFHRHCEP